MSKIIKCKTCKNTEFICSFNGNELVNLYLNTNDVIEEKPLDYVFRDNVVYTCRQCGEDF